MIKRNFLKLLKCKVLVFICTFFANFSFSQNLVPNPSFEKLDSCMTDISYSYNSVSVYCQDWFSVEYDLYGGGYFGPCFNHPGFAPILNSDPYSGERYVGAGFIAINFDSLTVREVLSSKVNSTLTSSQLYLVSFYIKNAKAHNINYKISDIGVAFTEDTLTNNEVGSINPSVASDEMISANNKWQKLEFYYRASGNEKFLNIGVFGDDFEYTYGDPSRQWKPFYYFIDDVSVEEVNIDLNVYANVFTPNNDGENDFYLIENEGFKNLNVSVVNRWGQEIYSYDAATTSWDGTTYSGKKVPQGVYYLTVVGEDFTGEIWKDRKTVSVFY